MHYFNNYGLNSALGSGLKYKNTKFLIHTKLPISKLAVETLITWQKLFLLFISIVILTEITLFPLKTLIIIIGILTTIYFIDVIFSLYLIFKSLYFPPEIFINKKEIAFLDPTRLPIYSILCPLYKESKVLPQFVESIKKIDWPKDRLDILLLLEEGDCETIETARAMDLPSYIKIITVPSSLPKTKPKACNYGLNLARGEYLVIFDAEDIPDPLQLKKAYIAFINKVGPNIFCLQAKLNYYNPYQNILTRLFTAEYSLWFDVVLPGLQSIQTCIPLGGTSNHFRTKDLISLGGWDPFNVTEDCDLGTRLFKEGYKTAIIDSTTFEEANSNINNWIRQRSRWIKGYFQTYLVHMRDPINFFKKYGWHALIFNLIIGLKTTFILINPILWITTISYFAFYPYVGKTIELLYPPVIFYMAIIALILGNFVYLYNYMIGLAKRKQWSIIKFVFLTPFYWLLMSISAVIAFYQLIFKPYFWEKTNHGLHIKVADKLKTQNTKEIKNKNNILIFNWYDTKHKWAGGAEIYVYNLAKELVKEGFGVTVFCCNDGKCKDYEVINNIQIIRKGNIYTVVVWAFIYYILSLRKRFDVVIDTAKGVPFFTPIYVRKPILGLFFHIHQEMFKMKFRFPLRELSMFLELKLMPFFYKNSDIVTISESSRLALEKYGLGKKNPIVIATPGVSPHKIVINKTRKPSLIYLGRLRDYKCVDVLICALPLIISKIPNIRLTVAGTGDFESDLKQLTKNLNLEKYVNFVGKVSDEEKYMLLAEAWLAIQPSIIEGWGITNIEANMCGTPVIASNVDGLRDSVIEGRTGILVPAKNINTLSNAVINLIENNQLRNELAFNAIEWSKKFRWESTAQVFSEIIKYDLNRSNSLENQRKYGFWEGAYET